MKSVKIITGLADRVAALVLPEDSAGAVIKCYNKPIDGYWWGRCYYNPACGSRSMKDKYACNWGPGSTFGVRSTLSRKCC